MASNSSCKCSMCLHCVCEVSDGFSKSSGKSWFPCAYTIWALTKPLLKSSVKLAKFKTLSLCQKVFLLHQTSSCKCSMCLHYTKYRDVSVKAVEQVELPIYALPMHHGTKPYGQLWGNTTSMPASYEPLKICMTRPRVQSCSMAAQENGSELQ